MTGMESGDREDLPTLLSTNPASAGCHLHVAHTISTGDGRGSLAFYPSPNMSYDSRLAPNAKSRSLTMLV